MSRESLTIAIVGCGKFAEEHAKEVRKIFGTDIVAVCDRDELMAEQVAERYGIPHQYTSVDAMYEDLVPDVVHITTPPQSHLRIGRFGCEHGSHIYVEKPFTTNYSEALELIEAARASNRRLTVGHVYHFDPAAQEMRRLIADGILGAPVHIEATMGYDLAGEYGKAFLGDQRHWIYDLPGGLFHNVISHLVERVLEFIPDQEPSVQVCSFLLNKKLRQKQAPILDELRVMLAGEDVTAYLTFSSNFRPLHPLLRVYGTKNSIDVDFNSRTVIVRRGRELPTAIGRVITGFGIARQYQTSAFRNLAAFLRSDFHYMAGMNYLLRSFYSSIRSNSAPPIPYVDILRTTKIMDLIFEELPGSKSELRGSVRKPSTESDC